MAGYILHVLDVQANWLGSVECHNALTPIRVAEWVRAVMSCNNAGRAVKLSQHTVITAVSYNMLF